MTSEQRIAEWAKALQIQLWNNEDWGQDIDMLERAANELIASVRAEAIEECAKVLDERSNVCAKRFTPTVAGHMCQALDVAAQMLRDRALVKERKGEE